MSISCVEGLLHFLGLAKITHKGHPHAFIMGQFWTQKGNYLLLKCILFLRFILSFVFVFRAKYISLEFII